MKRDELKPRRTTVYVDPQIWRAFNLYKQQDEHVDLTFSAFVNKALKDILTNPYNWDNTNLYDFAIGGLEGEEE